MFFFSCELFTDFQGGNNYHGNNRGYHASNYDNRRGPERDDNRRGPERDDYQQRGNNGRFE